VKAEVAQAIEVFRPITVTITLESKKEADAFRMLVDNIDTICEYVTPTVEKDNALRSILVPLNAKLAASGLFSGL
jgi:hypothetical protein